MKRWVHKRAITVLVIGLTLWQACSSEIDRTRESNVVILPLVDKTGPQLVSATPYDGLSSVLTSSPLTLIFNEGVDPKSIETSSDGQCTGSIQLSSDEFKSCVEFQPPTLVNQNQLVSLIPVSPLENVSTYKLKLTKDITDNKSNALVEDYTMQLGFTTVDVLAETLPNQLAQELKLSMRQAAGLSTVTKREHRTATTLGLTADQIELITSAAVQQVKDSRFYYATDISDILGAMAYGAIGKLGELGLGSASSLADTIQIISSSLVASLNGKSYYIRNSEKLLENLANISVRRLPKAGFTEASLPEGVDAVVSGMLSSLDTSGLSEEETISVSEKTLEESIRAASEIPTITASTSRQVGALTANAKDRMREVMRNLGKSAVESMSNWYWWDSREQNWSGYLSGMVGRMVDALDNVAGMDTDDAADLLGELVTGVMEGFAQEDKYTETKAGTVATALGNEIINSASNLSFSDGSLGTTQVALLVQNSAKSALTENDILTSVVNGLNTGMVEAASESESGGTDLSTILDTNITTPDLTAPVINITSPIGNTNDQTPSLTISSSEAGTYSESCSGTSGSLAAGSNVLILSTLQEATYVNCSLLVEDLLGNSDTVSIPSFTIDTTSPSLSAFLINNGAVTSNSRSLSLTWTASDALSGLASYYVAETASIPSVDSSGWITYSSSASYTLSNSTLGPRSVYLWVKDKAGNLSGTLASSITLVDASGPTIASFQIENGLSFTNQLSVSLTISASDDLSGITAYFADEGNTTPLANAQGWLAYNSPTYTFDNSSNTSKKVYLWVQDGEGNLSTVATDNITLDTVDPSLDNFSVADNQSNVNTRTVNLSVGATDSLSGVGFVYSSEDNSSTPSATAAGWQPYGSSTHTFDNVSLESKTVYVWVKDNAENVVGYLEDEVTLIDNISPTISSFALASGASFVNDDNISLALGGSDDLSGVTHYFISESSSTPSPSDQGWISFSTEGYYQFENSTNGPKSVYIWLKDVAGNISSASQQQLTFDNLPPVISSFSLASGASSTTQGTITISESSSDATSGIIAYLLTEDSTTPALDDSQWMDYTVGAVTNYTFDNLSLEDKTVYLWLKDAAGNVSTETSDSIELVDGTPPAITGFELANGNHYTNSETVSFTLSGTDTQSEITHYLIDESSSTPTSSDARWLTYGQSGNYTFQSNTNEQKFLYLWLKDSYNNISASTLATITLDNTAPSISNFTLENDAADTTSATVSLELIATDNLAVISHYLLSETQSVYPNLDSSDWIYYPNTFPSNYTFDNTSVETKTVYLWLKDFAGNIVGKSDSIDLLDGVAPSDISIVINGGANSTKSQAVSLDLAAHDAGGVAGYYLSENSTIPSTGSSGWVAINPAVTDFSATGINYDLSEGEGTKEIYVWFKDVGQNISEFTSSSINYTSLNQSWILQVDDANDPTSAYGSIIDFSWSANGEILIFVKDPDFPEFNGVLTKVDPSGQKIWSSAIINQGYGTFSTGNICYSNGKIYVSNDFRPETYALSLFTLYSFDELNGQELSYFEAQDPFDSFGTNFGSFDDQCNYLSFISDRQKLIKYDTSGNQIFTKDTNFIYLIASISDGGYLFVKKPNDFLVERYDSDDILQWSKTSLDLGYSNQNDLNIFTDNSEGIYVSAYSMNGNSKENIFSYYDLDGILQWEINFIENTYNEFKIIHVFENSNFSYVLFPTRLLKLDRTSGETIWSYSITDYSARFVYADNEATYLMGTHYEIDDGNPDTTGPYIMKLTE